MSHKKNYVPQFLKQRDINSYIQCIHVYIMTTVNTADRTGYIVKRNRFWRGRVVLCVTRCTRAGTPVVRCPQEPNSTKDDEWRVKVYSSTLLWLAELKRKRRHSIPSHCFGACKTILLKKSTKPLESKMRQISLGIIDKSVVI